MDILDHSGNREDVNRAIGLLKESGKAGFVGAQSILGYLYSTGKYVKIDGKTAISWYTLAAEQKDDISQYNLGLIYAQGKLVNRNIATAKVWLGEASKNGNKDAQNVLRILEKVH